jgi:hypothetical protein
MSPGAPVLPTDAARTRCAFGAVIALLGAALIALSPVAQIVGKLLCDPIAHATSSGAAIVTLLFVAVSALAMARRVGVAGPRAERLAGLLLVGSLLLGNAANLAGHFALLNALGLPARVALYQWSGSDNTYSYVFHSHAGKAALSALLAPLAPRLSLDMGQGLGGMLPIWIPVACLLSLIAAVSAYLWVLPRVVARFESRLWTGVLFGVATLNAAKAVIDGGLLSYRSVPAMLFVAVLVLPVNRQQLRRQATWWLLGSIALLGVYMAIWQRLAPAESHEALQAFIEFLALLVLLAALANREFPARRLALGGLAVVAAVAYAHTAVMGCGLLLRPLANDYRAVVVNLQTLTTHSEAVGGRRPLDIYRQWGDDPLKPRHVFILRSDTHQAAFPISLAVIAQLARRSSALHEASANAPWAVHGMPDQAPRPGLRIVVLETGKALQGAFAAEGVLAQNNYYCLLHGFAAQLHAAGLQRFTFVPLRDRADRDALRAVRVH